MSTSNGIANRTTSTSMLKKALILLVSMSVSCILTGSRGSKLNDFKRFPGGKKNSDPIIFVHGFLGWGKGELLGFPYWGAFSGNLIKFLRKSGFRVHSVALGPISSNYDQACELFAQIKGTKVDYGPGHSKKFGHKRYGRDYTGKGLFPEWGTKDTDTGEIRKVRLVAHSHGGKTVRILAHLMEKGSSQEKGWSAIPGFLDSKIDTTGWIRSITTISTPHNGTTLVHYVTNIFPNIQQLITGIAMIKEVNPWDDSIWYDFKLDHWGLNRRKGEGLRSYIRRIQSTGLWNNTRDISKWDLSLEGSYDFNQRVEAQGSVYYFSWSTRSTYRAPLWARYEFPTVGINGMFVPFYPFAFFMGTYRNTDTPRVPLTQEWWANDGIVNTSSMAGPTIGSRDVVVEYSGTTEKGIWHHMGCFESTDHFAVIGGNPLHFNNAWSQGRLFQWYGSYCSFLHKLE